MKKLSLAISSVLLSSAVFAQDIQIQDGWQLLGATQDLNTTQFDDAGCVDYLWKYNNTASTDAERWKLHVSSSNIDTSGVSYPAVSTLYAADGYWLKASGHCSVQLSSPVSSETNPDKFESLISGKTLYALHTVTTDVFGKDVKSTHINKKVYGADGVYTLNENTNVGAWKFVDDKLYSTYDESYIDVITDYERFDSFNASSGCLKTIHSTDWSDDYPIFYFENKTVADNIKLHLNEINSAITDCPSDVSMYEVNATEPEYISENVTTDNGDGTLTFNGLTYGTITSASTGRVWLDRDLGSSKVCTSLDDTSCYGDYYQWGRLADGHEKVDSEAAHIQASSIYDAGPKSALSSTTFYNDWARNADKDGKLRRDLWTKIDGSSVCPTGYRVPTVWELDAEFQSIANPSEALSKFNASTSGYRTGYDGSYLPSSRISYWSSTIHTIDSTSYKMYLASDGELKISYDVRTKSLPVRCIKDVEVDPSVYAGSYTVTTQLTQGIAGCKESENFSATIDESGSLSAQGNYTNASGSILINSDIEGVANDGTIWKATVDTNGSIKGLYSYSSGDCVGTITGSKISQP